MSTETNHLSESWDSKDTPIFTLKTGALVARGQMQNGKFVVLAGSEAKKGFSTASYGGKEDTELKEQLLADGTLAGRPDSDLLEFTVNTPFKSATSATGVILMRSRAVSSGWVFTDEQGEEVKYGNWLGIATQIPSQLRQARLGLTEEDGQETGMLEAHGHREESLGDILDAAPVPLNQILYGPPGTGKTYQVVERALAILDPAFLAEFLMDRARLKARYDEFVEAGDVSFVTFHQSFGYEDFIEGIKPVMQSGQLSYRLEDGIFLEAVRAAGGTVLLPEGERPAVLPVQGEIRPETQVWRIYIDGAAPVSQVRDLCLERGEVRIGSWDKAPQDLNTVSSDELNSAQVLFRDGVRAGDLVLLAMNSDQIGAVGIVESEYRFDTGNHPVLKTNYAHARSVNWLAKGVKASAQDITGQRFAPPTLQRVAGATAGEIMQRLKLPQPSSENEAEHDGGKRRHVLIIDEINRGNVAKIFGELITLLETGKRAGRAEALTAKLPLSRRTLSVPDSLYVIGTMNTADRSLTLLDAALRRRFVFRPVWPDPEVLPVIEIGDDVLDLRKFLYVINERIERLLSREQVIGHAYLLGLPATLEGVASALQERILPLLEEYFFEDWSKIRTVLADEGKDEAQQFVQVYKTGGELRYRVNEAAFRDIESFTLVYSRPAEADFTFSS